MNFSALSIRNPVPAIMLFILLSLAGLLAYKANPVQDFPDIELPIVNVSASLPGAAPAQLETEVARKIEDSIATLQGVKNIYTKVLDGVANVMVEFVLEKNTSDAVNEVRDAVTRIKADLPAELREPVVSKLATAGRVVLTFVVDAKAGAKLDNQDLSWFVDNEVTKRLLALQGIGQVKRVGGVTREIRVELEDERMAALRVSALDVSRQLRLVQKEAPGGRGDVSGVGAHHRHRADSGRPGQDGYPAKRRAPRAARASGHREGHGGRAARHCHAGRQTGGGVRDFPHQGRQRNASSRRCARCHRRVAPEASEHRNHTVH
jgi:multidrug efflux pump subunit AcrB